MHALNAVNLKWLDVILAGSRLNTTNALNAGLRVLIKMTDVIITLKIMPESPEIDLEALETKATEKIANFGGEVGKKEIQPVAFGLKALILFFVMDESIGSTEPLEKEVEALEGIRSVEVTDVRRAIG